MLHDVDADKLSLVFSVATTAILREAYTSILL